MSYDIELKNKKTPETAFMQHPQYVRGATVPAKIDPVTGELVQAAQAEASINITYNYSSYYEEATKGDPRFAHEEVSAYYADGTTGPVQTKYGIRGLYGKTPAESIPMLNDMIQCIQNAYQDEHGEWKTGKRIRHRYWKDGKEVKDSIGAILHGIKLEKTTEEYTVSEGDTSNYWERTAANAIHPLQTMLIMATDNLTNPDVVWEGD